MRGIRAGKWEVVRGVQRVDRHEGVVVSEGKSVRVRGNLCLVADERTLND